ncbi:MAG: prolipoprotein diacylglyceryl transferase [Spirochaetes bacterium GWF1_41_5]|nr:MAG: prolipoprotein diacylglyceryl transferase [Spirochaetes bacterium GWF1_41_5]
MNNFTSWWQNLPSVMNPKIFSIGAFPVMWYSMMYLVAFTIAYLLMKLRITRGEKPGAMTAEDLKKNTEDFFYQGVLGIIIGARMGFVLFYDFAWFMQEPWKIILPFSLEGGFTYTGLSGMSYHGGLAGLMLAFLLFCRKRRIPMLEWTDFMAPCIPVAYFFGRVGNFINGELYGRMTGVSWGMYFKDDSGVFYNYLRHPSQVYEALFEGIILFFILWPLRNRMKTGGITALYFLGYGTFRFVIEFFREPDPQLGFILGPFSMGQMLCSFMIIAGIIILKYNKTKSHGSIKS